MASPAEQQVDILKAGMVLANLVNYSNQLNRLCQCSVCTYVHRETKRWSDWCSESTGKHLQACLDQRCFYYQRCLLLQTWILDEIFEIVSKTHNVDRTVTFVAQKMPKLIPIPEEISQDMPMEQPPQIPPPPLPESPPFIPPPPLPESPPITPPVPIVPMPGG